MLHPVWHPPSTLPPARCFLKHSLPHGRTGETTQGTFTLAANENVIVYEKVTDRAGNTEYYSTENMVVDNVQIPLRK